MAPTKRSVSFVSPAPGDADAPAHSSGVRKSVESAFFSFLFSKEEWVDVAFFPSFFALECIFSFDVFILRLV